MSTVQKPLKYLWSGHFADGTVIQQPHDDRYSKHDDNAEQNPTAFRDLQDYMDKSPLVLFCVSDDVSEYWVDLVNGRFIVGGNMFSIEGQDEIITDRKLTFWREVRKERHISGKVKENGEVETEVTDDAPYVAAYFFGYIGKSKGKKVEKVIRIE